MAVRRGVEADRLSHSVQRTDQELDSLTPDDGGHPTGDVSLFTLGTTLLRNRWRLARWMTVGALIAALVVFLRPTLYVASASFIPEGVDVNRSGLASLAGQFGMQLPSVSGSQSPDFYAGLLKSRELLQRIARDTIAVPELGTNRLPLLQLLGVKGSSQKQREERAAILLGGLIKTSVTRSTGVVELEIGTRWPSVSLYIATRLLRELNEFNQRTRQGQAAAERKFVEGRLTVAEADLRAAEDRLQDFLRTNRQFNSSPELVFQRDRLQRSLTLRQEVYTSLTQALESARLREVRDTPVLTVIEQPSVPSLPQPRKRIIGLLFGLVLGGFAGALWIVISEAVARRRMAGDIEADEFVNALRQARRDSLARLQSVARFIRR